jgi:hypothetical protein
MKTRAASAGVLLNTVDSQGSSIPPLPPSTTTLSLYAVWTQLSVLCRFQSLRREKMKKMYLEMKLKV